MKNRLASRLLRLMVISAFLAAVSIVCGKYIAIGFGEVMRFSFENLPIIFAGMAFGPIIGAAVGVVADLVGCVLVGYAINPIITAGAAVIGIISGIYFFIPKSGGGVSHFLRIFLAVFSSHAVGSVIIKTFGLAVFYEMSLGILMLWRLLNYIIVAAAEVFILFYIMKSKPLIASINSIIRIKDKKPSDTKEEK